MRSRSKPKDMTVAIHLCRGNLKGAWMAEGGYEPIADALFNRLEVGTYCLEYDTERAGDFSPLRFLPKGKRVILGLVSTKTPELETKDDLKRKIDEAAQPCAARAARHRPAVRLLERRRRRTGR